MYCPTCKETFPNGAFCAKDGTALVEAAQTTLVGQVLADRYRIVRLLGEGGMGQVYEAQHLNINKRFAIKMLRPEVIGSAQSLQRFRQEAWAASSIGHENIVEIDDFATLPSGQVYLAMEFLDGQSLAERIRDGAPLAVEQSAAILIAVAHGLAAAHEKGIVHRDMKPENVFLARKGGRVVAKILDFGIAKMTGGDEPSNLTRTGAIFGTPLYMSPEQAKGKPADARADVYALGVILYELVTGSVPFGGDSSVEILSQHIGAVPVRPTELAPERGIAPTLETLVMRALEKEPDARFASMGDFARELEVVAATLPKADLSGLVTAPPAPPTGWNAQVKAPRPNAPTPTGARPSTVTPRPRATTGQPQARTPTGPTSAAVPAGVVPAGAAPSQAMSQLPSETSTGMAPPRHNGGRYAVLGLLALALVGGAAWLLVPHGGKAPANPSPQPLPPVPAPNPTLPAPEPTPTVEVILDSNPTGAKILRDGVVVAETPEALKLSGPDTVVLRKEGWADKSVTVDPAATRKLVVKLERAHAVAPTPKVASTKPAPGHSDVAKAGTKPPAPPKPGELVVDPYGTPTPAPKAATTKPTAPVKPAAPPPPAPKPHDELSSRVEKGGESVGHRIGTIYKGAAADEGGRSDWFAELEGGHCYNFVGEGGDGVKKLYLYLWGPAGKRLMSTREDTPHPRMVYCTAFKGTYHFQAKVDDGKGEYRFGIYTK